MTETNPLPFVQQRDNQWDGWVVDPSGDPEKDYQQGQEYAKLALAMAKTMNDPAPVSFTLAWIYAKAHLAGQASGAMEKGFIDRVVRSAMAASLN